MRTLARFLGLCVGVAATLGVGCGDSGSSGSNSGNGTGNDSGGSSSTSNGNTGGDQPFVEMCGSAPCCDTDDDCSGDTPYCGEISNCVECTSATEEGDCGDYSCAAREGFCTDRLRNATDVCFPCEKDTDCRYNMNCVAPTFDGQELPPACIYLENRGSCTWHGFGHPAEATSVDGVTATYCFPPSTTTCQGVVSRNVATCDTDAECGAPGLDDGYCPPTGVCTYFCEDSSDCSDCSGDPKYCH